MPVQHTPAPHPETVRVLGKDHGWESRGRGHRDKAVTGTYGVSGLHDAIGRDGGCVSALWPPLTGSVLGAPSTRADTRGRHLRQVCDAQRRPHARCSACAKKRPLSPRAHWNHLVGLGAARSGALLCWGYEPLQNDRRSASLLPNLSPRVPSPSSVGPFLAPPTICSSPSPRPNPATVRIPPRPPL